jgi:hypothetical protein
VKVGKRCALVLLFVLVAGAASAASTPDLYNGGDPHEGIGQGDTKDLARGVTYAASAFPLRVRVRPPDGLWGGVQYESGPYRFIQLNHLHASGAPVLHGVGYVTLEAAKNATPSAAAAIKRLRSTPHIQAGPIKPTHIAGFAGQEFDATIVGSDLSGTCPGGGKCPAVVSFAPFLTNHHCGFCGDAKFQPREAHDVKAAGKGERFRIIAFEARGKTVIVYIESIYADQPKFPPAKLFPTFLPYAQKMLANVTFPD